MSMASLGGLLVLAERVEDGGRDENLEDGGSENRDAAQT